MTTRPSRRELLVKPSSISARLVGLLAALLLIISALAAPPAFAKAACNSGTTAGTADIALVQAISVASNGNYIDHLTITNYGPCNVPNAGLTVTLPNTFVAFSSNPNSWTCTPQPPTGTGPTPVTCYETSTIGVPGTADIYLEYARETPAIEPPATGPINACAATFDIVGSLAACPNSSGLISDPNPANNTSVAALLAAGGALTYGPNGKPDPTSANGFDHTTTVALLDNGGLVNIYQSSSERKDCPPSVSDCFLGTTTINFTNVSGHKTWTLTFLASLTKKSLSQITVWNSVGGGAYTALSNCSGKHPTDPCVSSRAKSTNTLGETIFTIVVSGTQDNGMTAD